MSKVIKNGKVAVLYHPYTCGMGWSRGVYFTEKRDKMVFCPEIVNDILENDGINVPRLSKELFEVTQFFNEDSKLHIAWIPVGEKFFIQEHNGYETIVLLRDHNVYEA